MTLFGPLHPNEILAIVATVADFALTLYGVWSGVAREAGFGGLMFKGKKAALAAVVAGVVLHLLIRYRLSNPENWGPRMQAQAWSMIAALRGLIAAWNGFVLIRQARRRA